MKAKSNLKLEITYDYSPNIIKKVRRRSHFS